jgi:hypothetical protein
VAGPGSGLGLVVSGRLTQGAFWPQS